MANAFYVTNAAAKSMLNALTTAIDAGTLPVINIYAGTPPADADASLSSNDLLAQLTCSSNSFGAASDANPGAKIVANTILSDTSADSTNTATFFRILIDTASTAVCQGTVGTATSDLILNTTSITSGSTVSITAATITLPEGP